MIITEISPQKRKGRFNISVDNQYFGSLDDMALVSAGLKVGQQVDEKSLREYIFESEVRSAFDKTLDILSTFHSKKEILDRLIKKGYEKQVCLSAIEKAEQYGYVDDQQFAKALVGQKRDKSRAEIKSILYKKGVDKEIIGEAIDEIDEDEEKRRAKALAEKYLKNKQINQRTLASLYAFLARKGFGADIIKNVLRSFKEDDYDWD